MPASTYVTVSCPIHGQHSTRERTATANAVWNTQVLERNREAVARDKAMRDPTFEHTKKSALQCEFTLKWGRTMFGCPKCWLLPHFCVCNECTTVDTQTKVVLHLNQSEWCVFHIVVELSSDNAHLVLRIPSTSCACGSLCPCGPLIPGLVQTLPVCR